MSNSPLINMTILDPSSSSNRCYKGKWYKICKITLHHAASPKATAEQVAKYLRDTSGGSANYCIGNGGDIALTVPEEGRAYTSNNGVNDAQAVTIEVANDSGAPEWRISDVALARTIDLCVDICRRNGMPGLTWTGDKDGTLTTHDMFIATTCPGPYFKSKMPYIAAEVTRRVQELNNNPNSGEVVTPPKPEPEKPVDEHVITPNGGYSVAYYKEDGYSGGKTLTVTARSGLNCRKNAGMKYDIIGTFPKGTKVQWYGYYNKDDNNTRWLLVKGPKFTGYCMENFLK